MLYSVFNGKIMFSKLMLLGPFILDADSPLPLEFYYNYGKTFGIKPMVLVLIKSSIANMVQQCSDGYLCGSPDAIQCSHSPSIPSSDSPFNGIAIFAHKP